MPLLPQNQVEGLARNRRPTIRTMLERTLAWMLAISLAGFAVSLLIDAPVFALTLIGIGTAWMAVLLYQERRRR